MLSTTSCDARTKNYFMFCSTICCGIVASICFDHKSFPHFPWLFMLILLHSWSLIHLTSTRQCFVGFCWFGLCLNAFGCMSLCGIPLGSAKRNTTSVPLHDHCGGDYCLPGLLIEKKTGSIFLLEHFGTAFASPVRRISWGVGLGMFGCLKSMERMVSYRPIGSYTLIY